MLIDQFFESYDASSRHQRQVRASAWRAFQATRQLDVGSSVAIRILLALRGLGRGSQGFSIASLISRGFVLLGEEPGREVLLGVAGQFWKPDGGIKRLSANDFAFFDTPGYAKAGWGFHYQELAPGRTMVTTETRVICYGEDARRRFRRYWFLVRPFSGLIRLEALRLLARAAERPSGEHAGA